MKDLLQQEYYDNTAREYLFVLGIIIVSIVVLAVIKRVIIRRLGKMAAKTTSTIDDFVISGVDKFGLPILQVIAVFWSLSLLDLSDKIRDVIDVAFSVAITYFVLRLLSSVIMLLLESRIRRQEQGEQKIKQLGGLMLIINIFIWIIGIVFLLDNMGKNVTTIITGLGIGGIAVALAAQNILGDLFNYFVIYFDRPFEVGDFIVVDDKMGTVEYLGIKTTRIRALTGEQLVIGNSNLAGSRIHNYKRMYERRIVFNLNIDYRTPLEKIRITPGLLKSVVEEQKMARFDRAHFSAYGDWSLRFEVVYYVLSPDYNQYMDIQQAINLRINEVLASHEIFFVAGFHISMAPELGKKQLQDGDEKTIDPDAAEIQ